MKEWTKTERELFQSIRSTQETKIASMHPTPMRTAAIALLRMKPEQIIGQRYDHVMDLVSTTIRQPLAMRSFQAALAETKLYTGQRGARSIIVIRAEARLQIQRKRNKARH